MPSQPDEEQQHDNEDIARALLVLRRALDNPDTPVVTQIQAAKQLADLTAKLTPAVANQSAGQEREDRLNTLMMEFIRADPQRLRTFENIFFEAHVFAWKTYEAAAGQRGPLE